MKKLTTLFLIGIVYNVFAQKDTAVVDSVALHLAQKLVTSGITVTSASLNCGAKGAGTFTYTNGTTLGLDSGIVLTTGYATDVFMPAQIVSETMGNNFSDPDLATLNNNTSGNMNDVCYLIVDCVPICNQISIAFQFGSSEYDGFQCSAYNDVVGIFVGGSKPSGGLYNDTNIAVLPNDSIVSINNINNGQDGCTTPHNSTYYIDNSTGTTVVYEGLTTKITSTLSVNLDSTYRIKIAIADIEDEAYDSGIFLSNLSCSTSTLTTAIKTQNNTNGFLLYPNPAQNNFTVEVSSNQKQQLQVVDISGKQVLQQIISGTTTIDANQLESGVYFIQLKNQAGVNTQKIVVQH